MCAKLRPPRPAQRWSLQGETDDHHDEMKNWLCCNLTFLMAMEDNGDWRVGEDWGYWGTTHINLILLYKCVLNASPLDLPWAVCFMPVWMAAYHNRKGGGVNQSLNLPWKIEFGLGPGIRFLRIGLICQGLVKVAPRKSRPTCYPPPDFWSEPSQSGLLEQVP